ncbi:MULTISPECIES: hypothetical protein [unclassified Streptomyces]
MSHEHSRAEVEAPPGRVTEARLRLSVTPPEDLEVVRLATPSLGNRS